MARATGHTKRNKKPGALVRASTDKSVPTEFVGTVEPNYYCRGWNAKRLKYCRQRAGAKTVHPGIGRCGQHGGQQENDHRLKSGRYATIPSLEIRQMMQEIADAQDPLDVVEELLIAKAYLRKQTGGTDVDVALINQSVDTISKVIHRVEQARAAYAISRPELFRLMSEMGRQVEAHITELARQIAADTDRKLDVVAETRATLKRIADGWLSLRA